MHSPTAVIRRRCSTRLDYDIAEENPDNDWDLHVAVPGQAPDVGWEAWCNFT